MSAKQIDLRQVIPITSDNLTDIAFELKFLGRINNQENQLFDKVIKILDEVGREVND